MSRQGSLLSDVFEVVEGGDNLELPNGDPPPSPFHAPSSAASIQASLYGDTKTVRKTLSGQSLDDTASALINVGASQSFDIPESLKKVGSSQSLQARPFSGQIRPYSRPSTAGILRPLSSRSDRPVSGKRITISRPETPTIFGPLRPHSGALPPLRPGSQDVSIERPQSQTFMKMDSDKGLGLGSLGDAASVWEPRLSLEKTLGALESMGVTMLKDQLETMLDDWAQTRGEEASDMVPFNCFCWLMDLRPVVVTPRGGSSRGSTRQSSRSRRTGSNASRRRAAVFARAESTESKLSHEMGDGGRWIPALEDLLASKAKLTCVNLAGVPVGNSAPANSVEKAVGVGGMLVPPSVAEPYIARLVEKVNASNVNTVLLYDTKLSDAAAIVLAGMLKSSLSISTLSVRCNQISDLGTTVGFGLPPLPP